MQVNIWTRRVVPPAVAVLALLVLWQALVSLEVVPRFMLPGPVDVARALVSEWSLMVPHAAVTLAEALLGLAIGVAVGFVMAMLMDTFDVLYRAFSPLITVSQTIPVVAIAPVLVLWCGYGMLPKVLLVILTTFFPVATALASGFKQVSQDQLDLMRTMGASRWQTFVQVKIPAAAEGFFAGLKISATYAIVGAVVAEWLGGFEGLGIYMQRVRKSYSYDSMFACVVLTSALSLLLLGLVDVLERVALPYKRARRSRRAAR